MGCFSLPVRTHHCWVLPLITAMWTQLKTTRLVVSRNASATLYGTLALCLRTLFWNRSGNVRQTCANACCNCSLEGLPAGSPWWFHSCMCWAFLADRLWLLLGCDGTSLLKQGRDWHSWDVCSGWVNVSVGWAALVVCMSCHVIPDF